MSSGFIRNAILTGRVASTSKMGCPMSRGFRDMGTTDSDTSDSGLRHSHFSNTARSGAPQICLIYFLSDDFDVDSAFGLLSFLPDSFPESLLLSEDSALELDPAEGFLA
jgi:hypothetical protein